MQTKKFFRLFADSFGVIYSNPSMIFFSLIFGLISLVLSRFGRFVAPALETTAANSIWLAVIFVLLLAIGGFMSSGFSGMVMSAKNGRARLEDFYSFARKSWLKTGAIFIFFVVLYNLVINGPLFLFTQIMINARDIFTISEQMFRIVSFIIAIVFLFGVVIFFSLSHICLVVNNSSIIGSMKNSMHLVRKDYLSTLSLLVVLFVLYRLIGLIPGIAGDLVLSVLLFPYTVVILTLFVKGILK